MFSTPGRFRHSTSKTFFDDTCPLFTPDFIDFETGLLSITKTLYYRTMTDYKFVEPKTQASIRTIYIDSDTLNELKAWQSVQQQVLPDCPLVLSYNGTPTSKTRDCN